VELVIKVFPSKYTDPEIEESAETQASEPITTFSPALTSYNF